MAQYYTEKGGWTGWLRVRAPEGFPCVLLARLNVRNDLMAARFASAEEKIPGDLPELPWPEFLGLPLHWPTETTAFRQRVWQAARRIPPGRTCSYGRLAQSMERPQAVRAVAQALKRNPFAWRVPCHRVVYAHGGLGGFAWGVMCKAQLLAWEKMQGWDGAGMDIIK